MDKLYLYIEPYVYLNIVGDCALIYNTVNNQKRIVYDKLLLKVLLSINTSNNHLLKFDCNYKQLDPIIKDFISWLKESFSGDVIKLNHFPPVLLMPSWNDNIIDDVENNKIFNLIFYLNTNCKLGCKECNKYSKQTLFCRNNGSCDFLDTEFVLSIASQVSSKKLNSISFIGGDISKYIFQDDFIDRIEDIDCQKKIYLHILQISNFYFSMLKNKNIQLHIMIPEYYPINLIKHYKSILDKSEVNYLFDAIVSDNKSVGMVVDFPVNLIPLFDNNRTFFSDNVFLNLQDIEEFHISIQEIVNNNSINTFFLGNIIIDSNGDTYSSFLFNKLGNLKNDSFSYILSNFKSEDSAWRLVRKNLSPCCNCIFHSICPPISNYELSMNQFDLCHYNKHGVSDDVF